MDLQLTGKRAVVTGASDGIGAAISKALVAEGVRVLGAARRTEGASIPGLDYVAMDLAPASAPAALVEEAVGRLGGHDILVNNVGAGYLRAGFASMTDAEWEQVLNLNLMTAIRAMRAALPQLVADGGGVIVNIASVNAVVPAVEAPDYSTSKAALLSVGKAVAGEYARAGVRVVTVSPSAVATPFWLGPDGIAAQVSAATGTPADEIAQGTAESNPLGRFLEAEEVADTVAFLASPRASAITGTDVRVDGGFVQTM
jgi:NAD(P)-dependent dehydrogenase (short-subunit alcohol dehydrogenase family)